MRGTDPTYLTTDRILAHPNFPKCREAYLDAVLKFYEFEPSLIELMLDGGRIMVYAVVMAMWGSYRDDDPESLPSISRLKKTVDLFGVASARQIDLIVARFVQVGYLQVTPAPSDLRMRIVLPTPVLIEHDRAFIKAHYTALAEITGAKAYPLPLSGDIDFLKVIRGAWIATLEPMAKEIFSQNRSTLRFYAASAGMLMLMRLVQMHSQAGGGWFAIDYTDFGRRFSVSRTHVRTLLKAAAADDEIEVNARGSLRLQPKLLEAFDRNVAGRMSLLDRAHASALASLTPAVPAG